MLLLGASAMLLISPGAMPLSRNRNGAMAAAISRVNAASAAWDVAAAGVFFQAEGGIPDYKVTGVQTCALPILVLTDFSWASFVSCCSPPRSGRAGPGPASRGGAAPSRSVLAGPVVTRLRDRDPGRPEDPVAHPVTGLQDLDASWLADSCGI